jgi:methylenetetrahydrofolate dehydrogenase (NADP+) / methenyltetrahydrofolate cyclohydrolase
MEAQLIDGVAIGRAVRDELRARVAALPRKPGLAVILVGENAASKVYVRNKTRACDEVGLHSELIELPEATTEAALLDRIDALNHASHIHGILVQLPLPRHIAAQKVLEAIAPAKDVDGFHLHNVGALVTGDPVFAPCTPAGVMAMLAHEGVDPWAKHAVVVGASNIVGKPMAMLLLQKGATVTICNSKTPDLGAMTRQADILVVATGRAGMVTRDMVKPGAVVIDVGINRLPDGKLVGDVDFAGVRSVAAKITPVPGGVGPMTVTMLLANTVLAAERSLEQVRGLRPPAPKSGQL